jgi:hypothetical protein
MIKFLFGELPPWAKQSNPLLRYDVHRHRAATNPNARIMRIAGWAIVLALLGLAGYFYATEGLTRSLQMPYTLDIWRAVFFPLLLIQIILRVAGFMMGVNAVSEDRRRQTWDNLRSTEMGAELSLRTRWVSILFYRLRGLLALTIGLRIVLVVGILYELTSMQGEYLTILTSRAAPSVPMELGVVLLAGLMTAFILMPITATGVDVALGLLISSRLRHRTYTGIAQILVGFLSVGTTLVLLWLTLRYLLQFQFSPTGGTGSILWLVELLNAQPLALDGNAALALFGAFSILGDWGLIFSQLTRAGELWAEIPYSIYIGIAMLAITVIQVLLSEGMLRLATRFAERNE